MPQEGEGRGGRGGGGEGGRRKLVSGESARVSLTSNCDRGHDGTYDDGSASTDLGSKSGLAHTHTHNCSGQSLKAKYSAQTHAFQPPKSSLKTSEHTWESVSGRCGVEC